MNNSHPKPPMSSVAQFTSRRIYDLRLRRTQTEIAAAAGLQPNMLSMLQRGKAKVPMERVIPLAKALECDPKHLVRLALEQTLSQAVLDEIFAGKGGPASANEQAILARVREISGNKDPELNELRETLLVTAFSSRGLDPKPAVPATIARSYANMMAVLLIIETAAAQRELGMAKKFAAHVNARMERVSGRLHTLRTELEQLVKETRS